MNIYYWRVTGLDMGAFWRNIVQMAIVPGVLILAFKLVISKWVDFYDIRTFMIGIVIYSIVYAILMFLFVLNEHEKNLILRPLKLMLKK